MAINFPDSPSVNDTHVVGDKTWSWNGTYWHVKQGLTVSSIKDADNDTKVQVEEGSDDDIIRFDTAGSERMTIAADGTVTVAGDMTVAGGDLSIGSTAAGETLNIAGVATASGAGSNLIVKSGDATGTNQAGAYLALKPGMGTGSSTSGDILLQTGPAGSSGTTANTPATVLTAMSSGNIYVTNKLGIGTSSPAHPLHIGTDGGVLALGADSDLKISAGSNSFIDHNGNGDLWIRANATGEHIYMNAAGKLIFQRLGVTQMEARLGATTHEGSGNNSNNTYGGIGFAAAGVYLDRHWLGNPGFTVCNQNAAGNTAQGTFRIHGSNHTYASYPSTGGSDFAVNLTIDGSTYGTSDRRRKTNIEDITGALAMVNAMQGRTFNTINSDLDVEDPNTLGGKKYGFIAQEVMDIVPHAVMQDEGVEPLENGWCREYHFDYGSMTAVLVEAVKELSAKVEALENA